MLNLNMNAFHKHTNIQTYKHTPQKIRSLKPSCTHQNVERRPDLQCRPHLLNSGHRWVVPRRKHEAHTDVSNALRDALQFTAWKAKLKRTTVRREIRMNARATLHTFLLLLISSQTPVRFNSDSRFTEDQGC